MVGVQRANPSRPEVDDTWYQALNTHGRLETHFLETVKSGHAVTLVGLFAGPLYPTQQLGSNWGDCGFGYASLGYVEAGFTEAYGISVI